MIILILFLSGRNLGGMDVYVFLPMITIPLLVVRVKWAISAGIFHGNFDAWPNPSPVVVASTSIILSFLRFLWVGG